MWSDLLAAIALVLVLEGLMPFLSPDTLRRTMQQIIRIPNQTLRVIGLISMASGVVLLYLVRHV
jgi:hypothetical protein